MSVVDKSFLEDIIKNDETLKNYVDSKNISEKNDLINELKRVEEELEFLKSQFYNADSLAELKSIKRKLMIHKKELKQLTKLIVYSHKEENQWRTCTFSCYA